MELLKLSKITRQYVKELFPQIKANQNSSFMNWLSEFKLSHGELDTQRQLDLKKLSVIYDVTIKNREDAFKMDFLSQGVMKVLSIADSIVLDFTT